MRGSSDPREALAAAWALVKVCAAGAPPEARARLEEADPLEDGDAFSGLPWDVVLDLEALLDERPS